MIFSCKKFSGNSWSGSFGVRAGGRTRVRSDRIYQQLVFEGSSLKTEGFNQLVLSKSFYLSKLFY